VCFCSLKLSCEIKYDSRFGFHVVDIKIDIRFVVVSRFQIACRYLNFMSAGGENCFRVVNHCVLIESCTVIEFYLNAAVCVPGLNSSVACLHYHGPILCSTCMKLNLSSRADSCCAIRDSAAFD
jgi:hypothetical protein